MIYRVTSDFCMRRNAHELFISRHEADRRYAFEMMLPAWRTIDAGEAYEPAMLLHPHEFTALMQEFADEAWRLGIKPSNFKAADSTALLDSTRYHLEDMRRLVFKP